MRFGLLGKSLEHSFSKAYFSEKFENESLVGYAYDNFEIEDIAEFPKLLKGNPQLKGLNVTIPYKQSIVAYLDELSAEAEEVGAVNTILIKNSRLSGYNTDVHGFRESLKPLLRGHEKKALVLGTGGAARAVKQALKSLEIEYVEVSRNPGKGQLNYQEASKRLSGCPLVVNTTPLGTFPKIGEMPPLNLDNVSENHLFYDLIYNPPVTRLLREAKKRGARIKNGREMLMLQAEKSWDIWQQH